ncbi:hypothetical protein CBR_g48848 [Chara braunii]|uniref:Uncharacterized protein n=1 Tax=Chara braunii TaxID=69332 RepID=A0A388M3M5_CHABU|nr:hypothetical protein CBR_g48848 [Chara braunii]|eukprot:GBG89141.1 hypothetical protein CBR_g48848 [Chara braunii]
MKLPVAPISRRARNFTVDAPRETGMNLSWNCADPAQAEEIIVLRRRCSRPNLMSRSCRARSSTRSVKVVADGLGRRVEEHLAVEGSSDGIGDIVARGAGGVDCDAWRLSDGIWFVGAPIGDNGGNPLLLGDEGVRELRSLRSILMNWTTLSSSEERDEESSESKDASGSGVVNSTEEVVEVVSSEAMLWKKRGRGGADREREAEAAARATSIADQVALLQVPEANADRFQERLAVVVAALVRLRNLEDLESRVTALEQRNQELQAEIISLKQSQLSAPRPPNPQPTAVPVSQSNTVLMARVSGTVTSAGTGASSSSGSADSSALVIVSNAGTSAQNATVLTSVQYSSPVVHKRAATLSSKYDGKAYITSWISSMRSYFEVMRTPQEDRSMIMGTNTEPAVQNHIELQAIAASYERIDLTELLKVTSVRTLEDLLITRYQDKHVALKAKLKFEALKGQTWRSSMQALEQHLTGLFTTPDLGMTDVSCMDVVMGVAPKEYLSLLALKDHTTWRKLMTDLVNLEAKDLARRKKAPAAGGQPQRKRYGSSNQLALHEHREVEDQSYADDLSLDDDLESNSDMGCSTSAIESDVNEDEKLNAFKKTASTKGPNRGSGRGTIAHLPKNAKIPEKPEDASTKPWEALRISQKEWERRSKLRVCLHCQKPRHVVQDCYRLQGNKQRA